MDTLDSLTTDQKAALEKYLRAVQAQFGDTGPTPRPDDDDSFADEVFDETDGVSAATTTAPPPPPPPVPNRQQDVPTRPPMTFTRSVFSVLKWPVSTFWNVTWSLLMYFYTIFPQSFRLAITGRSTRSGPTRPPQDAASVAARFLREYEENYGTTHPNFYAGGYSAALSRAKNELKFLLVYLHSDEHDATDAFCKETLSDSDLLSYLRSNDFLVWGGDVKESEGYQVATTLQAVKYPFIGLIALSQSSPSSSSTKMVLIDRIEGSYTAEQIVQRLTQQTVRHSSSLDRLRAERREREMAREIRQQQDDAYQQSLRADREKARQQREAREAVERQKQEEERIEAEKIAAQDRKERHLKFLFENLPDEPLASESECARLSFKLWNGERVVRRFRGTEPVEHVYIFIETIEFRENGSKAEFSLKAEEHVGYNHEYDFVLISPFPRTKIVNREKRIMDDPALWPSASLVVELTDEAAEEGSS
ncbi:hypothetical protein BGW38_007011 [Lunasporangiospora selenospora]|uniref:UBX domain-containing protein n=1 Tax=Lunasporangiospora selenospora TaxID=979761 RepID=A0A9P6FLX4_9FUNG|nr:hypothetical protein BGW38_007011 [Lunasporangiospora selenospora]